MSVRWLAGWAVAVAVMGSVAAPALASSGFVQLPIPNLPSSNMLIVSPSGPYTSITAALADAQTGDTIAVRGGTYGPLVVEKSVVLEGVDWPAIDGGEAGTVVTLRSEE